MLRGVSNSFTALALVATLSACTVTFTPGEADVRVRGGIIATVGSARVDARWPVSAPPGARSVDVQVRGDRLRYDLIGSAGVRPVYDRLHVELVADGWRRTDLDVGRREVEAEYRRGGSELEVQVVERGRDRVRVTIRRDD